MTDENITIDIQPDTSYTFSLTSSNDPTSFINLTDTPNSYTGEANHLVAVNATEDGLIFTDNPVVVDWGEIHGTLSNQTDLQAALDLKATVSALSAHTSNTSNPHSVTKTQVGLGNVDNTSDLNKPISTATQTALDLKADESDLTAHIGNTNNPHSVTKTQVGLSNVPNVDATNASNISSGTLDGDRLPDISATKKGGVPATGTPSGKFLKDDSTWATVSTADEKVKYDSGDPTAGYLSDKIIAGSGISLSEGTGPDQNKLKITSTAVEENYQSKITSADTTPAYLIDKVLAGTGISVTKENAGANEDIRIANTSPDQTVSFSGGSNVTIGGTYPNFTITDNSQAAGAYLTAVVSDSPLSGSGTASSHLVLGTVPISKGGTGQTTKVSAFDALSPMTNAGDIIFGGASGTGERLAIGSAGEVLHSSGSVPQWGPVIESDISLSNNTTNNVSTAKHGFAPQLPNLTTQFLRGDGAWASPASTTIPNAYYSESFAYTGNVAHNLVHNFGTYPVVQAFDTSGYQVIPMTIQNIDTNTIAVTFSSSATYTLVLTIGSPPLTNYTSTAVNYTMLATDYIIEETGSSKIVTLLTPVGRSGKMVIVKNSSAGICDIQTAAGLIDGVSDITLSSYDSLTVVSNGTNWLIV